MSSSSRPACGERLSPMTVRINPPTFVQRQCAERVFGVFDHSFQRKWVYHLSSCEAAFDTGYLGDLQMVMVKSEICY